jgi:hypothetical protein
MRFAKIVFLIAGVWGLFTLLPLYFMFDVIGRKDPPAITHPQFYFGFLGVTVAWQIAFFVIANDPVRFRPMIIPSLIEKLTYIGACIALYLQQQLAPAQALSALPDAILVILFGISFAKLNSQSRQS